MKHFLLLFFVTFITNPAEADGNLPAVFNALNYLDREEIVSRKISQVTLTISLYDHDNPNFDESMSEEEIEDVVTSCFKLLNRFDMKGNLVGHTIQRVGSWVVYQYDDYNNITRFGWWNKSDGTLKLAAKDPKDLLDTQRQYEKDLSRKSQLLRPHESTIVDNCSSVDGIYLIHDGIFESGLPKQAKAKLLRNAKVMFKREEFRSPEMLYIYFEYEADNYLELNWGE
ncbi:MAG: hypothetical protein OQJ89_03755 [Kangiellaceae bacterium]|nr:hypothetical protein [Kangiellaceae bacterium]MCW9016054.1 hypothetical protein [Kangiellaceae bacterium]